MTQANPDDITLDPKSDDEVVAWLPVAMREYEESRLEAGDSADAADTARAESERRFFPDGRLIDGHQLFTIRLAGEDVGWFWLGPWNGTGVEDWWIYDIRVYDEFQRRGIARIVMQRADGIAREGGAKSLGLNAFAYNVPAITLYESLGYLTASLHMRKDL